MRLFKIELDTESLNKKAHFILHRLLLVSLFAILIVYASRQIVDLDLWLHIKTGEVILKTGNIPAFDIFSFTITDKPWINHEWLFQTLAYFCYTLGQGDGLIFMQNVVTISIFFLLLLMGLKNENHVFMFVLLYVSLLAISYRFTIRPDIFSLFFLTLYLCVLTKFTENRSRAIWLLPFCQVFWVNMHGFFFTGPLIVLIFLFCEIIKRIVPLPYGYNRCQRLDDPQMKQLLAVLGLCVLASLANPYGASGAAYPVSVLGQLAGKGKIVFQYIQELAKPITRNNIFSLNNFFYYKALILLSLFSFRFNQKNINITHLFLWLLFLIFSFSAIRNIAYFIIIASYVTLSNVDLAFKNNKTLPFGDIPKKFKTGLSYLFIAFLFYYPAKGAFKYIESSEYNFNTYQLKSILWDVDQNRYPKKAVEFLLAHKFPAHMLNDFNSGAYLIGQVYPKRQVFIDGRTELYGPEFFLKYVQMGEGKKDVLEKTFAHYNISGAFLTNTVRDLHLGLLQYLFKNPHWKVVYFDDRAIIFLKDTEENRDLISKFRIDLEKWTPPPVDFLKLGVAFRYPGPPIDRARLLDTLGCFEAAAAEARLALLIMPNNAEALKFMSNYYFYKKDYFQAYQYARNALIYASADTWMRSRLALIYHALKDDRRALDVINSIIRNNPKNSQGYYVKALILKDSNKPKAKEFITRAIALSSKDPRYHLFLGDLFREEKNMRAAKKEWNAALEYDSSDEATRKRLNL